ncbi:META domain-containing protein [Psychromonas aquimarina]|uniref:META domain-containing protein n=1 Tax=Psychromonas aquimarina TaxID=444919 RepID=UPI0004114FB8|nr:META domain-containing protein [Psychromonas aquimarina]
MKKLYWTIIAIITAVLLAETYALYKIPKTENISGKLTYEQIIKVEPGTVFRLSLESRPQGDTKFVILSASENNAFTAFPQKFTLSVLEKSLSRSGLYQLRAEVVKDGKTLFITRNMLPLTRKDLTEAVTIIMQAERKPKAEPKSMAKSEAKPESKPKAVAEVTVKAPEITTEASPEPVQLDTTALLAGKYWVLDSEVKNKPYLIFDMRRGSVVGSGGCNKFQGGYKIEQHSLLLNNFISTAKHCDTGMEVEKYYLTSLTKVKSWSVTDNKLYLYDENKLQLLQFNSQ